MTTSSRRRAVPLIVALAIVSAGCGSRVSHDEIVQANGVVTSDGGTAGASGSAVGPETGDADAAGAGDAGTDPSAPVSAGPAGDAPGSAGSETAEAASSGGANGAGSAGGGGASSTAVSGPPIVVGNAGSYTGLGTAGLDAARKALQAWAADVNARGGLKGRQVKLVIKDDGGDASKGRAQVQEMVEKDKVVALVGNLTYSSSADAWQGYLEQKKVPAIGGNCAAKGWNSSSVFFSQCPSPDSMFYGAVFLGAKFSSGKKFGALVCTEDAVCTTGRSSWFDKGYAKKVGLDPVYSAEISLAQPDFTAQCVQAESAGVQLLGIVADPATTKRIMASCSQQGYTPQYLTTYGEEAVDTPKFARDIISAQLQLPFTGINTASYKSFIAVWSKYNKSPPTPFALTTWASAKIFERAANGAKEVTPAGLVEALYTYRNERFGGLTIPLSYGPRGTSNANCIFYMRGSGGKWTAPQSDTPVCW